ncbi:uncharacterized protein K02A2.6-like [Maniola jurtina]|nr:uncharacterized protein K02A2.6-like [Maniola jurtina]
MLARAHFPHLGITKTVLRANDAMYWPRMIHEITDMVSRCETCIRFSNNNKKETLMPHVVPELPWEKVGVDLFQLDGCNYMIVIDYYSKFPEIDFLRCTTSESIIDKLKQIFSRHGIPKEVFSDGGPQFSSDSFKNFARKYDFKHTMSSPEYPQSNGMVEREVQTIKKLLKKALYEKRDPYLAILEFRNTPISNTIASPAENLFNRKLRGIIPMTKKAFNPKVDRNLRRNLVHRQEKDRFYYNRNKVNLRNLELGEHVFFKTGRVWKKGIIKGKIYDRTYKILSQNGRMFVRNRIYIKPLNFVPFYIPDENENLESVVTPQPSLYTTSYGRVIRPPVRYPE